MITFPLKKVIHIIAIQLLFFCLSAKAQTIVLVPNPDASPNGYASPNIYTSPPPIVYNNDLYIQYQNAANNFQLAQYNGSTITLISNPDGGPGYEAYPIVYKNKIYIFYKDASALLNLAQYNGTSLSVVPGTSGCKGFPIIYNNDLYFIFKDSLAQYDGTTLTILPNPDGSFQGFKGSPIVYNNKLYYQYENASGVYQLAQYDGTTLNLIPNPVAGNGYLGFPIAYNNKLFVQYENTFSYLLGEFDGTTLSLVPSLGGFGYYGGDSPVVYNNRLYIQYANSSGQYQLAQYDTTTNTLSLIPNPDAGNVIQGINPYVYNGNLYIGYTNHSNVMHLAKYDGTTLSIVANPDGNSICQYCVPAITYNNLMYFQYQNNINGGPLAQFDGNTISLITNPDPTTEGYDQDGESSIVFNNNLYFQYENAAGINYLGYLQPLPLPITWINFTAQLNENSVVALEWETAQEINCNYFNIQRSVDDTKFTTINKVDASSVDGISSSYLCSDSLSGITSPVVYYRLQEVDNDGKVTYSNIRDVTISKNGQPTFIYPNPATTDVFVVSSMTGTINIYNVTGQSMKRQELQQGTTTINISDFAPGVYYCISNGQKLVFVKQ